MNNYKKNANVSQKSLLRSLLLFLLIASISLSCDVNGDPTPAPDIVVFNNVSISNAQEVPMTGSTAMGSLNASYEKNSNRLDYTITYTGLTPMAMHFHKAGVGVAGPVEVEIPGPYTSGMSGSLTLTDAQETDLLANNWYINIHTTALPAGEIRGQVVTEDFVLFANIALSGKEEVPANASAVTGTFNGVYDKVMKMLTYNIVINGATPSAMHLHKAGVGVNGDVIIPIPAVGVGMTGTLTAEQEADLIAGNYYFNAHTAAFPGGEVRGQVVTDNMVIFSNDIIDDNEVPPTGSSATGNFYGAYNKTTKALSYVVRFSGLTPTAMHFHKAAAGVNGPVVVAISAPYTTGMAATATLTAEQEADMLGGLWYINIHSAAFGAGEIRGQLIK